MGTKAREILGMEASKLVKLLNKAYADEWLAYYQYWVGSKVVKGHLRGPVASELAEHADDELRHAGMLTERIIQLGGTPLIKPEDWYKQTHCGYEAPEDPLVEPILVQNVKGEQCAIGVYDGLLKTTKDKDPVTYNMLLEILEDEIEHEEDLQTILEDMKLGRKG